MDNEREVLINRLMKLYPYNREWFEGRTTPQLIAMYNQPVNKKNTEKMTAFNFENNYRRYNDETGQWEVKTDGLGWQPEI